MQEKPGMLVILVLDIMGRKSGNAVVAGFVLLVHKAAMTVPPLLFIVVSYDREAR